MNKKEYQKFKKGSKLLEFSVLMIGILVLGSINPAWAGNKSLNDVAK